MCEVAQVPVRAGKSAICMAGGLEIQVTVTAALRQSFSFSRKPIFSSSSLNCQMGSHRMMEGHLLYLRSINCGC